MPLLGEFGKNLISLKKYRFENDELFLEFDSDKPDDQAHIKEFRTGADEHDQ